MVKTDDPANKNFYLTVTGQVAEIARVEPGTLSLSGKPGETLQGVVSVTPAEGYPFSVLSLSQKFKGGITAELIKPEKATAAWQVKVSAFSEKPDDLYDIITLKTDSPYKPEVQIRVYAIYFDASAKS